MTDSAVEWRRQLNAAMSRFVAIELEVGLTFAQAVSHASWTRDCLRYRRLARRAYDNANRWVERTRLTRAQFEQLSKKLITLQLALGHLGDPAPSCQGSATPIMDGAKASLRRSPDLNSFSKPCVPPKSR
jgi:hypothetical protein